MSSILKFFKPENKNTNNDVDADKSSIDSPPTKRQKPETSQSDAYRNLNASYC